MAVSTQLFFRGFLSPMIMIVSFNSPNFKYIYGSFHYMFLDAVQKHLSN